MAALARLAVADQLDLGEGWRFVGSFRAHGPTGAGLGPRPREHAEEWEAPALAFAVRLAEALAAEAALTDAERRARDGILGRQFTLR